MGGGYGGDRRGPPGPGYFDGGARGRSPPRMDPGFRGGGGGRDRSRSPPYAADERRGGGPPPAAVGGYGSGASSYGYRGPARL